MRLPTTTLAALSVLVLPLCGCIYRLNVQQGNYLEGKTVGQLQVGMTRSQVRYLLGTPMVPDIFNKDRWDYLYYFKTGHLERPEQRHLVVLFKEDKVMSFQRDNVPNSDPRAPDNDISIQKFPKI
jgi:outer membrane protein assembly factor BamE